MFKRKIYQELVDWHQSGMKKAVLIKGLRQVGKTYIIRIFCHDYYQNTIEINFKNEKSLKDIFNGDLNVDKLVMKISAAKPGSNFIPHKTVLFFDEIQDCAGARSAIKPFVDDGRYDVVASGSLLGLRNYNQRLSQDVPVGYEHIIKMHALDFEEFLWALGIKENVIDYLKQCYKNGTQIDSSIHQAMLGYFKEYMVVGGMPSIVTTFLANHDINATQRAQKDLIEEYRDDFGKHLDLNEDEKTNRSLLSKIEATFNSIPDQLAKENKKFQYSIIGKGAKSRDYDVAVQWLLDYGLVMKSYNLRTLQLPLEGNKIEDTFKLFMTDSGLLVSLLENGTATNILNGDLLIYKGAIFENAIADALNKKDRPLYYFRTKSGLEIDFVERINGKATLVEVKSASGRCKSSDEVLNHPEIYHVESGIKLGQSNIGRIKNKITIPYYLAFLL